MGNLGGAEILVIFLVALIVLGPAKLPDAARQVGRAINEVRRVSSGFQKEMRDAMHEPLAGPAKKPAPTNKTAAAAIDDTSPKSAITEGGETTVSDDGSSDDAPSDDAPSGEAAADTPVDAATSDGSTDEAPEAGDDATDDQS